MYSQQVLIDTFGVPNPSAAQIFNWKEEWATERANQRVKLRDVHLTDDDGNKIGSNTTNVRKCLKELEINPLFFHITYIDDSEPTLCFYNAEDVTLFKLST